MVSRPSSRSRSSGQPAVPALVALSVVALVLDALDGWVARRTRTASAFGARFDGEADAFLMLVLSAYVAAQVAGVGVGDRPGPLRVRSCRLVVPWLRGQLPPRYWRKVVTATRGDRADCRGSGGRTAVDDLRGAGGRPRAAGRVVRPGRALVVASTGRGGAPTPHRRQRRPVPRRAAMKQDERTCFDMALERARVTAYPPGEFVGQESFMLATEIRSLAVRAGIAPGVSVLDLCCGVAGPGRFITAELGCTYLGVDASASAIEIARERPADLPCRFAVAEIPPVPRRPVRRRAAAGDAARVRGQGRRCCAPSLGVVAGRSVRLHRGGGPTTDRGGAGGMPDADTVWPVPLSHLRLLAGAASGWSPLDRGVQPAPPADRRRADPRVRCPGVCDRGRSGTASRGRAAGRPPAVERLVVRRGGCASSPSSPRRSRAPAWRMNRATGPFVLQVRPPRQ